MQMTLDSLRSTVTLNNGVEMPVLGLGTWKLDDGSEAVSSVRDALEVGYRHLDTATAYKNEESVGRAVREFGDRDEVFITTKLWNEDHERVAEAFDESRQRLGVDVIDLYLIHWPLGMDFMPTWKAMEKLHSDGKVRAIGLSNFMEPHLRTLLDGAEVKPAVDQVEMHPWLVQKPLHEYLRQQQIVSEAWSPLMQGRFDEAPELAEIGEAHGKHPAQVLIRWGLQHGAVMIPKSSSRSHIEANADVFDFQLSDDEMARLDGLDKHERLGPDPMKFGA